MTERPRKIDEKDIAAWVEKLPSIEADGDFRARLKSEFAEGRFAAGQPAREERRPERPTIPWWRWMVPAAAAAVLVIAIVNLNRGPALRVAQAMGVGDVRVDGRAIALNDTDALDAAMRRAGEIESPAGALIDLMVKDVVLFEVAGGTRMSIPKAPGRWFGRAAACSLFVGEMRIKTGQHFSGSELAVFTPEGRVEITGTLVSIQRDDGGTCVCVIEGIAYVGRGADDMQPVSPGYRKVMLVDGTAEIIPILPLHRDGVLDFDKRMGDQIEAEQ